MLVVHCKAVTDAVGTRVADDGDGLSCKKPLQVSDGSEVAHVFQADDVLDSGQQRIGKSSVSM